MRITYQRRHESHPTEVEVKTWLAWRELIWDLGVGVDHDGRMETASAADCWRRMVSGELKEYCLAVGRGQRHLLGTMDIKVLEK